MVNDTVMTLYAAVPDGLSQAGSCPLLSQMRTLISSFEIVRYSTNSGHQAPRIPPLNELGAKTLKLVVGY